MKEFDFEIIYKKVKQTVVVGALIRIEETFALYCITSYNHMWLEESFHECKEDNSTRHKYNA